MSEWVGARTPRPPEALRERILLHLGVDGGADAGRAQQLCASAAQRTIRELTLVDRTGRESAIDLLAADALITYAIEAAVDSPDFSGHVEGMVRDLAAIAGDA